MSELPVGPGDELPPSSCIARSAKHADSLTHPPTQAFRLRRKTNETELSAGWLGYFHDCPSEHEQLGAVCTQMAVNYTPGKTERLLCVDVDRARLLLLANASMAAVKIVYSPETAGKGNPSHASIVGTAEMTESLEQLTAQQLALSVKPKIWDWSELRSVGLVLK